MSHKPRILETAAGGTGSSNTATSGKILIGDGTNFVSSTPTYPTAAGTSGNVLTSNGTNWTSAAPAGGGLGYVLKLNTNSPLGTPADATTYFLGQSLIFDGSTASGVSSQSLYIPQAGTITKVYGATFNNATLGSAENSTLSIRLNNTTDTTVSSTVKTNAARTAFSNAALSIAVAAGDYIEFKFLTPTWATNPTGLSVNVSVYIS